MFCEIVCVYVCVSAYHLGLNNLPTLWKLVCKDEDSRWVPAWLLHVPWLKYVIYSKVGSCYQVLESSWEYWPQSVMQGIYGTILGKVKMSKPTNSTEVFIYYPEVSCWLCFSYWRANELKLCNLCQTMHSENSYFSLLHLLGVNNWELFYLLYIIHIQ